MENSTKLMLRVFKRSNQHLVLLWRKIDGIDPLTAEISFKDCKNTNSKSISIDPKFINITIPVGGETDLKDLNVSEQTVICLVKEQEAGLNPDSLYYVKVKYGTNEEGIKLMPCGVFPDHEKEQRDRNSHLYAWDAQTQTWRKLSGVRLPNGVFALATVVMDKDEQ